MVGTFRILPQGGGHRDIFAWSHGIREAVAPAHRMVPFWYSSVVIWRTWSSVGDISDVRLRLHGPQPETYVYSPQDAVELVGVAIAPELASLALNIANHEVAGQVFDWSDKRFAGAMAFAMRGADSNAIAEALVRPVLRAISDNAMFDIDHAIRLIRRSHGTGSLSAIRQRVGIADRQFRLRFKDRIGISAKGYCRLLRANALIAQADRSTDPSWADLSHRYGFYDQAHMINELRELTGRTPARLDLERRKESLHQKTESD
ncbi:MAG: AraC family transcriptional regulator [Pseudomonadota bacterium]